MIPNESPWIVEIDGIQFAAPEAVLLLLKAVSEERDSLLAVARAAAKTVDQDYIGDCTCRECKGIRDEVKAALAAVEDLL